ncbi:MAG: triose-phosphate isomerase [Defluviitaleaceae bacterium]|nr:triose-phosphate isomerase [Defluviitaleaceae bacterium]
MRKKIIAGNWKMNFTPARAAEFANSLVNTIDDAADNVEVVLCVPYVAIDHVQYELDGTDIKVGAQNMHAEDKGEFTGEISGEMLAAMCVPYVIIGHSERRKYYNESDTDVNKKAHKALEMYITPIVCVGETLEQRKNGEVDNVLTQQTHLALVNFKTEDIPKIVIAYEPIWAIGTGETATPEQAQAACKKIRSVIKHEFGEDAAEAIRILYGGSVNPSNANELFAQPDIDGGLVGGASQKLSFAEVVKAGQANA